MTSFISSAKHPTHHHLRYILLALELLVHCTSTAPPLHLPPMRHPSTPSSHSRHSYQSLTPTGGPSTAPNEHQGSSTLVNNILSSLSSLSLSQHNNSRGRLRLDAFPANPHIDDATFLDQYIPLPKDDGAIAPLLAALTAFQGPSAQSNWMQLQATGNREHDPRYYIKETTRRLQAYYQISDVIYQLVCSHRTAQSYHSNRVRSPGMSPRACHREHDLQSHRPARTCCWTGTATCCVL